MKEEFRILSTTAILGYGFPKESFDEGMKRKPDLIAVDAGSTDPGPFYLGEGVSFTDRGAVKRDLEIMICAGVKENIPVVIGTAGGSGAKPHLEWCADIIREIAKEHDLHFKMAMIHADMDKEEMKKALIAAGIPDQRIILDYAGLRTLDSVVRAHLIFGLERFTLISQQFHNERAIYLAQQSHLQAIGYNAQDVSAYAGFKTNLRELLARVKVFVDIVTNKAPKHLGEKVKIPE